MILRNYFIEKNIFIRNIEKRVFGRGGEKWKKCGEKWNKSGGIWNFQGIF